MNILTIEAVVQTSNNDRPNPVRVSDSFAACNVRVPSEKGSAFLDVVGANGMSEQIATLTPGDRIIVTGRLDSHKGNGDQARWRIRFWADELAVVTDKPGDPELAQIAAEFPEQEPEEA